MTTSELQFGFKANHSTTVCSMVLKETLAYYSVDGGTAFCTFLDATKAFDRVDYCKIFRELLKRDIPSVYVGLLLNMYTNSVAKVRWNGACSTPFNGTNGVKQGGIVSPVLLCIYLDGLLLALRDSKVGCYIGQAYVGALAYADDITLLAPTARAIHLNVFILSASGGQKPQFCCPICLQHTSTTRNRKRRRAAAKPAACVQNP